MFSQVHKTNWICLATVFLLAVLGGVAVVLQHNRFLTDLAVQTRNVARAQALIPTKINANFLTQVTECFIPVAGVYGYTLRLTSGFRTTEEQDELFEQGRTVDGHIISWAPVGKSIHNYGYAMDVVDRWRGYNIDWKKIAKIGAYCGLQQVDDPHFEYRGGLTTDQFAAGARPRPLTLPCALMGERARTGQPLTREDLSNCGAPKF